MTLLETVLLRFDLIHHRHFILQERVVTSTNQREHYGGKQKPVPKNNWLLAAGGLMGRKHLSLDPCLALTNQNWHLTVHKTS